MFSGELATLIGGRYKSIYIQFGGMPGLARIGLDEEDVREYQADILNTVLLKDVIMRNQIRNVPFLQNLVRFLADNTGKIISANGIAKYMKSQGESVTFMESGFLKAMTNIILKTMAYAMHYLEERGKEISKRLLKILFVRNLYGVVIHCM